MSKNLAPVLVTIALVAALRHAQRTVAPERSSIVRSQDADPRPGDERTSSSEATPASSTPRRGEMPTFDHVFVIVLENHSYHEVVAKGRATFINSLANAYASAGQYFAISHPSQPNYLAMVGGDDFGAHDDHGKLVSAPLITDRLRAAGKSWKGYMQSMPAGHPVGDAYPYVQKHDPFVLFDHVRSDPDELAKLVPYTRLSIDLASSTTTPAFAFIVPDLLNDMHDGSLAQGDAFVRRRERSGWSR